MMNSEAENNKPNTALKNDLTQTNGLERQIEEYKSEKFATISFKLILKPAAISFIALIIFVFS